VKTQGRQMRTVDVKNGMAAVEMGNSKQGDDMQ